MCICVRARMLWLCAYMERLYRVHIHACVCVCESGCTGMGSPIPWQCRCFHSHVYVCWHHKRVCMHMCTHRLRYECVFVYVRACACVCICCKNQGTDKLSPRIMSREAILGEERGFVIATKKPPILQWVKLPVSTRTSCWERCYLPRRALSWEAPSLQHEIGEQMLTGQG